MQTTKTIDISEYLADFSYRPNLDLFSEDSGSTEIEEIAIGGQAIPKYVNEFWTSKQRQASSLHEISYRACFKAQLPRFFIELLTQENDGLTPIAERKITVRRWDGTGPSWAVSI